MPMVAAVLSSEIRSAMVNFEWTVDGPELTQMCDAIANACVAHIQNNAIVVPGIPVTTPVGPGSTSGPGTIT